MFRLRTAVFVLILTGLLLYISSLNNKFNIIDDEDQILNHTKVHSIQNIPSFFTGSTYYREETQTSYGLFYRPLMLTTYSIIYAIDGPRPLFFHLAQIILHIASSVLILLIFKKFLKLPWAFLASLIFLIHPINSETILHIANLQETLFLFFGLSGLLLITKGYIDGRRKILLAALMLLTLFSKETGILFIAVSLIYVYLFDKKNLRSIALNSFASVFIYAFFRFGIANIQFGGNLTAPIANAPLLVRLMTVPKILFTYIGTFIFPWQLSLPRAWIVNTPNLNDFFIPLFLLLVISALIFIGYKILNNKKDDTGKLYLFFLTWFLLGLLPHLQIIPLDSTLAERWFYFPLVGLLGMTFLILNNKGKFLPKKIFIVISVICVLFFLRTFLRTFDWVNSETLISRDLSANPENYYLENTLGTIYLREKNYSQAKPLIEASVQKHPYFGNLSNLALIYAKQKDYAKAKDYFQKAIAKNANYTAHENYANFLAYYAKDYSIALEFTKKSLKIYPNAPMLWLVLAQTEYKVGNKEEALKAAEKGYNLLPFNFSEHILTSIKQGREIEVEKYVNLD